MLKSISMGKCWGYYPNGYTPFSYDITPYLRNDGTANQLAVFVEISNLAVVGIRVAVFIEK